jgi:transketolase
MTQLMLGSFFQSDFDLTNSNNDRIIFSKGHASPLFYSMYAAIGKIPTQELLTFRKFDSILEGHPTPRFDFTEATTGSLGQGLGIGLGLYLGLKLQNLNRQPKVWVMLGDSEMSEGSIWETMELAAYNKANNLIGIVDVNRLGQRGQTMEGYDLDNYKQKTEAFGWETFVINDGHDLEEIANIYNKVLASTTDKPKIILAKTIKGKGVSFLEDVNGWHGKTLNPEQTANALKEINYIERVQS